MIIFNVLQLAVYITIVNGFNKCYIFITIWFFTKGKSKNLTTAYIYAEMKLLNYLELSGLLKNNIRVRTTFD